MTPKLVIRESESHQPVALSFLISHIPSSSDHYPIPKLSTQATWLTFGDGGGCVVAQVDAAAGRLGAGRGGLLPVLHDVREGELDVVLACAQHKVLRVEVDEGVEQDVRRVCTQLLTLPEVLLLNTTHQQT